MGAGDAGRSNCQINTKTAAKNATAVNARSHKGNARCAGITSGSGRWGTDEFCNRSDKAVSTLWNRLNESWRISGVAQRLPELDNGAIQTVVEFDVGFGRPKSILRVSLETSSPCRSSKATRI
jgi:hypothetical protein